MSASTQYRIRVTDWARDAAGIEKVRRAVFVVEQSVPESMEWDEADLHCVHVIAETPDSEPAATGRLEASGKIGRMAVLQEHRQKGLGAAVLDSLIDKARERGMPEVHLNAQVSAIPFYARRGFAAEGDTFDEAGIPHRLMRLGLDSGAAGTRTATLDEYRAAALGIAERARRSIAIFTHDLEPRVFDQTPFMEAVKQFILRSRNTRLRVLVIDSTRAAKDGSRLVSLGRRLSSYVEFRRVHKKHRRYPRAFLIADNRGIAYRINASRWEGVAEPDNPVLVRDYLDYFEEVWNASIADPELRRTTGL